MPCPGGPPPGIRQRLSLVVAMIHGPEILILDEASSGVDPVARNGVWRILAGLSRQDGVTIFVSTHFMNEAAWCGRISLMHAGKVLISETAAAITKAKNCATPEDACIAFPEEAAGDIAPAGAISPETRPAGAMTPVAPVSGREGKGREGKGREGAARPQAIDASGMTMARPALARAAFSAIRALKACNSGGHLFRPDRPGLVAFGLWPGDRRDLPDHPVCHRHARVLFKDLRVERADRGCSGWHCAGSANSCAEDVVPVALAAAL